MSENKILIKAYRGPFKNLSRKDLRNLLFHLNRMCSKLKNVQDNEKIEKRVRYLNEHQLPIPYKFHKTGAGNRRGGIVGRCPLKCYRYMIDFLKNFRVEFRDSLMHRFYIESSSARRAGGYRRAARGSLTVSDRVVYRVVLEKQLNSR